MSLIETHCPNCKKKIFLDLEEVVSESATRPIKCSQCGNEFIFGFDSDAYPVEDEAATRLNNENGNRSEHIGQPSTNDNSPKTRLIKKVVVKRVPKSRPKSDKRVLIIEDSTATRLQIAELFSDSVQNVVTAQNAEEGLGEIKKGKPDLLIVDLVLPQMSVAEFITIARKYIPTKNIVIFTAAHATNLDIFDERMEGINLVFNSGPDSFDELREKGMLILGLEA